MLRYNVGKLTVADDGQSGPEPWALRLGAPAQVFLPPLRRQRQIRLVA
jgi:hypothetical protein